MQFLLKTIYSYVLRYCLHLFYASKCVSTYICRYWRYTDVRMWKNNYNTQPWNSFTNKIEGESENVQELGFCILWTVLSVLGIQYCSWQSWVCYGIAKTNYAKHV